MFDTGISCILEFSGLGLGEVLVSQTYDRSWDELG